MRLFVSIACGLFLIQAMGCATSSRVGAGGHMAGPAESGEAVAWPLSTIAYRGGLESISYAGAAAVADYGLADVADWFATDTPLQGSEAVHVGYWRSSRQSELLENPAGKGEKSYPVFGWEAYVDHPYVNKWLNYFRNNGAEWFDASAERLAVYLPMIETIALEEGVFPGIAALALIESGMNPGAVSRVGASGMWQFMPSTGKRYGLDSDFWMDWRLDPHSATRAAIRHLRDLYDTFGSWPLAFAAYNAGAGRIRSSIRASGSSDFWEMLDRGFLPRETRNYVPKIVAATHMLNELGLPHEIAPALMAVTVPAGTDLMRLSWFGMVNAGDVAKVNPAYRVGTTPPGIEATVWLPTEATYPVLYGLMSEAVTWVTTGKVFVADKSVTPMQLQSSWGLPAAVIAAINGIGVNTTVKAGQTLLLPVGAEVPMDVIQNREERVIHRVRTGETLSHIAQRYGTSVGRIKNYNGLRSSKIYPGQRLVVKEKPAIGKWAKFAAS